MIVPRETLRRAAASLSLMLDETALDRLDRYAEMLIDYNAHVNLTAITDPEGIALKHFADSLTVLSAVDIPAQARCIDIGTGAGFPGVVLMIARPDLKWTLVDSTAKKLAFIRAVIAELGLDAEVIHARAEELGRSPEYRERFDFATARAVAALGTLCEYCLPFVRPGGYFIAMKGPDADNELAAARTAISILGGGEVDSHHFPLADAADRNLLTIKKLSHTPPKYPRPSAQIARRGLGS